MIIDGDDGVWGFELYLGIALALDTRVVLLGFLVARYEWKPV